MARRRITSDESARVPFAMVAVLILMLSIFSMAYLGGIQRQEAGLRLVGAEVTRQETILNQIEEKMALEGFYIASKAVAASTQFLCNQSMLDICFQENYTEYLNQVFPLFIDPYLVEVRNFNSSIFLEERNLHDLVPSNKTVETNITLKDGSGTSTNATVEVLDTVTGEKCDETSALARYNVVGFGNCTVRNTRSGTASEREISFQKSVNSPFPLLNSKAMALESGAENNAMGLARAVKYMLTTIAQFRVLEGYGSGLDDAPGLTSDIIGMADVRLAVNLAVLLETVRLFRSYDEAVVLELDTLGLGSGSLKSLFEEYVNSGTLDPADIVAIFTGLGDREIPADMILAQAFNAIVDQFILKYLDYFGIMDLANAVYKSVQTLGGMIEDVGKTLSQLIWGDDGENRKEAEQVTKWLLTNTASLEWPPAEIVMPGVVVGVGPFAPTDLAVLDVLQPINAVFHYSGNCTQLVSEYSEPIFDADSQLVGERHHASLNVQNVTADTVSSIASSFPSGYLADFQPASMIRQTPEMLDLWKDFYELHYAPGEDVIYDTIRDAVKNVTYQLSSLITSFMGTKNLTLSGYADGQFAIDPKDRTSTLQGMRDMIDQVITDTVQHLQANPGTINSLLAVLTNSQSQLTLRLMEFVSQNYDVIVDKDACTNSALFSLSMSMLQNSTKNIVEAGTYSEDYSIYNDLGHARGFVDEPYPYDCAAEPNTAVYARVLLEQNMPALTADILPFAETAYSRLRDAEAKWVGFDNPENGLFMQALEGTISSLSNSIFLKFISSDASSFVGLARDMVIKVLDGIIWSGEVSNTQYSPELLYSDDSGIIGFDMYEGEYETARNRGTVWTETFDVRQPDGALDVGTGTSAGVLAVSISNPMGVHYTDVATFNERPFENLWNVTIQGEVRIQVTSSSLPYLGDGTHEPVCLDKIIELNLDIPVLAYSGWDLSGVEYASTSTLAGDAEKLLDIVGAFFEWVWETIAGPINWIIDQVMKIVDFFADIVGKLLAYASDIMNLITEIIGFLVEKVQEYLRDIADWVFNSIVDWIIDLLPDGSEFRFSLFGFNFLVAFATDEEMDNINAGEGGKMLTVGTEGEIFGAGFDVCLELWSLSEDVAAELDMGYDLLLKANIDIFDFMLDINVDPFMVLQDHLVECTGTGNGWGLELAIPVVECYDSIQYSLQDIPGVGAALSNIPIPFLGMKASVNAGLEIVYTLRGLEEDNVVINEVEMNPRGLDEGNQWVELYNPLSQNASMDGWVLGSSILPEANVTFNSTVVLEPFGYYIVQYLNSSLPTESFKLELIDPGGAVIDSTPVISEPDSGFINDISIGPSGCQATWQRNPNGANLTLAGKWNFTQGSIGAENAAIDIEFKPLVWALLKGAFNTTWQSLKDQLELSLDFIVKLVTQFIQRFIEDVLLIIERSVIETSLFLDVQLTDMTGSGGGGITLSFVIEGGDTLAAILRWVIGSVAAFLAKFGKPTQPAQYPKLAADVPEHLYVRLDFYGMVQMPKMLKKATSNEEDMPPIKLAGRIEANIPALAALVGKDMGQWRINFGAYIEKMPANIADPLFGTGDKTPDVWLFKGTVYEV
ncbi:MAG: lamin tail domain-containing protein [Thermoplasmata archaeon]|nr:lamin tail domain-containing protein [Thermoplasmata archaeon]